MDAAGRAGAEPVALRTAAAALAGLAEATGVIVDTTARAYDPFAVLRAAAAEGVPSLAVAPHDDVELRRAALEAGAGRVRPYRVLFEHADREIASWLAGIAGKARSA